MWQLRAARQQELVRSTSTGQHRQLHRLHECTGDVRSRRRRLDQRCQVRRFHTHVLPQNYRECWNVAISMRRSSHRLAIRTVNFIILRLFVSCPPIPRIRPQTHKLRPKGHISTGSKIILLVHVQKYINVPSSTHCLFQYY